LRSRGHSAILYLDSAHHFSLKYGAGRGTNNRAEIYALWILLKVAVDKQVRKIQVLGDSKLVMDWANGKAQIILERILEIRALFEEVSFAHIFREFNHKVDHLSKEALALEEGMLSVQEVKDHIPFECYQFVSLLIWLYMFLSSQLVLFGA
jgi:ribonuclease HI